MPKDTQELLTRACANIDCAQQALTDKLPVLAGGLGAVKHVIENINKEQTNE